MSINEKVTDGIDDVSGWSDAEPVPEFKNLLPILGGEVRIGPQYTQREVLIINSAVAMLSTVCCDASEALDEARALLDAFDASREVKP